jgi:hypothetical protein
MKHSMTSLLGALWPERRSRPGRAGLPVAAGAGDGGFPAGGSADIVGRHVMQRSRSLPASPS